MILSLFINDVFPVIGYVNKNDSLGIFFCICQKHIAKNVQLKYCRLQSCCTTEKPYISVNLPADLNDSINKKHTISVIYGPFYVSFSLLFGRKYPGKMVEKAFLSV